MILTPENRTSFSVAGNGPTVVLLHGLGLNHQMWEFQLPELIQHFQVLRYDLLGHGDTVPTHNQYSLDSFVDQLVELLDGLQIRECALVGFSLGGMIARSFAIKHSDRAQALVVLNSPHNRTNEQRDAVRQRVKQAEIFGPDATAGEALKRWFTEEFLNQNPQLAARIRGWIISNKTVAYTNSYRVLAEGDLEIVKSITKITCPTLVVACAEDYGNSPEMAVQMADLIPDAIVKVIPDLKHLGLIESPASINSVFIPFLKKNVLEDNK